MQAIDLKVFNCPEEAPHYRRDHPEVKPATLVGANVVMKGTESGSPTVDLIFDLAEHGTAVAMVTLGLLRMLVAAADGAESRRLAAETAARHVVDDGQSG